MKIKMTGQEAATVVSTIHGGFEPEEVSDVIFVVRRKCRECNEDHVVTVFGTAQNDNEAIWMLSKCIQRIIEEGPFDV